MDGRACKDYVHMYVGILPKLSASDCVAYKKGKSTPMLFDRHPKYRIKWEESDRLEGGMK